VPDRPPTPLDLDNVDEDEDSERELRCVACDHAITKPAFRLSEGGRHIHVFTNPHGYTFQIGCFSEAPGAGATGPPSDEWAWFPGTVWRAAACRGCLAHIGWSFERGEALFWGLITAKLK